MSSVAPLITNLGSQVNLQIATGTDFSTTLTLTNPDNSRVNLTGCSVCAAVKRSALSSLVVLDFVVNIAADPTTGVITLTMPDEINTLDGAQYTGDLVGQYVWDMRLVDADGLVSRPLYGTCTFWARVTPPP